MLDHGLFNGDSFDNRSAWSYLIAWAAWDVEQRRYQKQVVTLQRGQHVTTYNQLKHDWGWGWDRVRRFMKLLVKCEMIGELSRDGLTIVTICNYELYQGDDEKRGGERGANGEATGSKRGDGGEGAGNEVRREEDKNTRRQEGAPAFQPPELQTEPESCDGLVRAFFFCRSPGLRAKRDAIADLRRQGVDEGRIMTAATDPANRARDFYRILSDLRPAEEPKLKPGIETPW